MRGEETMIDDPSEHRTATTVNDELNRGTTATATAIGQTKDRPIQFSDQSEPSSKRTKVAEPVEESMDTDATEEPECRIHGLAEAQARYRYRRDLPDFVLSHYPRKRDGGMRRTVLIPNEDQEPLEQDLVFAFWDENKVAGFWTIEDNDGDRYIVRYSNSHQAYLLWAGLQEGYKETPIAYIRSKLSRDRLVGAKTDHFTPVSDCADDEHAPRESNRYLRERTANQLLPYTMDRERQKQPTRGRPPKDQARSSIGAQSQSEFGLRPRSGAITTQFQTPESECTSRTSMSSATKSARDIYNHPTLYISTEGSAPTTIYLRSCPDPDSFYRLVPQAVGIQADQVRGITVTFEWMSDARMNTVRMVQEIPDTFDRMMEEVQQAPGLHVEGGRVVLFVNVQPK